MVFLLMSTVVNSYCLDGRVDLGFSLLATLFKSGLVPDVVSFNTTLNGFINLCEPNKVTFGIVIDGTRIDALCKDKMVDLALCLWHGMIDMGIAPDIVAYSSLCQGFCNLEKWNEAKYCLTEISFVMVKKAETSEVVTYNMLMDGYRSLSQIDDARRVFDVILADGLLPDMISYNISMQAYFDGSNFEGICSMKFKIWAKFL
ncbi:OLC1v1004681C1 [Oldenlandia corymbosa var. corymbosa]|uniref:OLC1v1004681C1 n=1 Tax=Oldenlandia corymbosa var. corymbosa TaxID=529605 RepID=A0AAV1DCV0_OLDCO|nr:OLC1v1004681C1 [Oldenlandia corymbosa var. corymbosa]